MKRNTRKGFTGIELVIVIAIIAILAASLIPAFGGLINGAKKTADIQGAREMDAAIKLAALGQKLDPEDVIRVLDDADFDVYSLTPLYKDHAFYWHKEGACIILANTVTGEVSYPEGQLGLPSGSVLLTNYVGCFISDVDTVDEFAAALEAGTSVKLNADITLEKKHGAINITTGNVEWDLNGHTITMGEENVGTKTFSVYVKENASLTLKGEGTLNTRAIINYGTVTVQPGVIIHALDKSGGGCIRTKAGGTAVINGGEFYVDTFTDQVVGGDNGGASCVHNDGGTVTINGGKFVTNTTAYAIVNTNGGQMTINGGEFTAHRGILSNQGQDVHHKGETIAAVNLSKMVVKNATLNLITTDDPEWTATNWVLSGYVAFNGDPASAGDGCVQEGTVIMENCTVNTPKTTNVYHNID